jgi:hypothetical protein
MEVRGQFNDQLPTESLWRSLFCPRPYWYTPLFRNSKEKTMLFIKTGTRYKEASMEQVFAETTRLVLHNATAEDAERIAVEFLKIMRRVGHGEVQIQNVMAMDQAFSARK